MSSIDLLNQCPNLYIWKKTINSEFTDINEATVKIFGFRNREAAAGKTDYDIPCKLSDFASTFREQDSKVLKEAKTFNFLEIQPCANDVWKILHVIKTPYYENNAISGVVASAVDIRKSFVQLQRFLLDRATPQNSIYINRITELNLR